MRDWNGWIFCPIRRFRMLLPGEMEAEDAATDEGNAQGETPAENGDTPQENVTDTPDTPQGSATDVPSSSQENGQGISDTPDATQEQPSDAPQQNTTGTSQENASDVSQENAAQSSGENAAQSSGGECFGYAAGDSARGTLREYTLTLTDKTGNVIISMGKGIGRVHNRQKTMQGYK